ncbi:dihydroorotate dehydrogenase [Pseudomonas sp. PDM04]|jgi:dihydropyrimidine dehydrogenase (NAD+) subunit PreA/dihydroorotate dehydrogenase (NAD+) catalytic subunit|uniref:dihydroorotate dehydrogenase n=1 Tax=Pseudomonas sp. PDM04 TaxID=2769296 RepID=UPI001780F913|nr:dihydroorotate dehydrogenase [Pseudomonas sp. PDM04]MBD9443313.1 dihydroorotate dehydrogenase [Pseudomonas sp. PDM04]
MTRLTTTIGRLTLKNPVICGAGEQTMTADAIRAALASGAGAVVAKSTNESAAAKEQLDKTDYVLLDAQWNRLPWDFKPPAQASLFGRSGLVQRDFDDWLEELRVLDREARMQDAYVIPSLILSDLEQCAGFARRIEQAGLRVLELNIGAPHGEEAAKGAIVLERGAERIEAIVRRLREATSLPLWIKLTGQSEDVVGLAQAARRGGADSVVMMGRFMGFLPDLETGLPLLGTSAAIGGSWALPLTARWLMQTRRAMGDDYPLIATNGARSGLDVARFLLAGACATEMTSAVFTGGYQVLSDAIEELDAYVAKRGSTVTELLGSAADQVQTYQQQPSRPGWWEGFAPKCQGFPG